jgi:hypothetical protein
MRGRGLVLLLFLGLACVSARAQLTQETFGRNRIQYEEFKWQYLSSENFDVYFYGPRKAVATEVIQYLESEFDRITDILGAAVYLKTKVFLYNSVADLQQSNMGLNKTIYTASGETEFVQPYVEIAHPGNIADFKEELIHKVTDLLVNEMMFGGSLKDMFQNAVLLNLPEWFIDGVSRYVARGWSSDMDDFVRQLIATRRIKKAFRLRGEEAALVGQSLWNYLAEKYGKSSISNILNYTRVIRNEERSVLITLGIPFRQLVHDWEKYYTDLAERTALNYAAPPDSNRVSSSHPRSVVFTTIKISPDGKYIAYAENNRGRFYVRIQSLVNGREITVLSGGNRVIRQTVDHRIPLLSWADANTLGVIGTRFGRHVFWLYDLNSKSKLPRDLDRFSNIRSFDFSANGRLAVLSADFEGQNDLFLISSRRDRTRRLTNDVFDDLDPSFIPGTNRIVFSSNRTTDSINTVRRDFKKAGEYFSLFVFDLDTTTARVERITNTLSKDTYPFAQNESTVFYLSDQRGINNLFRFDRQTQMYTQVTNFNAGIKEFDLNFNNRTMAFVMKKNTKEELFVFRNFNLEQSVFTPPTRRKEIQQVKAIAERRKREETKSMTIKDLLNQRMKERQPDTPPAGTQEPPRETPPPKEEVRKVPPTPEKRDRKQPVNVYDYTFEEETPPPAQTKPVTPAKAPLNTDNYVFEDEAAARRPTESFLNRYLKARDNNRISGPFPYEPKFSYDNLVLTPTVIDPLRGGSARIETQMTDILENFRFRGGMQVAYRDLRSGDVFGEIDYLPHRVDFSFRYDRRVYFWNQRDLPPNVNAFNQKYTFQKMEMGASLPLSVRTRISLRPFLGYTRFVDRGSDRAFPSGPPTFAESQTQFYAGTKAELVYDNSITTGLNLIEGTRGKLRFTHFEGMGNKNASFSQITLDLRHYQKLYKDIVFAVRGFAGSFFGHAQQNFALGGMDNWIVNRINFDGVNNPLASEPGQFNPNFLFTEFITNLRGFDLASLYGSNVMVANAELRLPLARALASGPVTSNFFRNMQLTAFYDIGTSWSGPLPFDEQGGVRTRLVRRDPFSVELQEFINPWLYSYGVGFRSMMLGYYLKFDLAWPVENYHVQNPRLFLTFGLDF